MSFEATAAAPAHHAMRAIAALAILLASPGTASLALESEPEPFVTLEPFVVTGSRLTDPSEIGALPVSTFTPQQLELAGAFSITDLLRNLPFNTGGMMSNSSVTGLNGAHTGLNLRGLGNGNTLVLVDGFRAASFGQPDPFNFSPDVGNLPVAAIQSVEILKDGASAVHGSDAVAGVINIRLRSQYSGTTARAGFHQLEDSPWNRRTFSVTTGIGRPRYSVMLTADAAANGPVFFSERPVSQTEDLRRFGGVDQRSSWTMPGEARMPSDAAGVPAAWLGRVVSIGRQNGAVVVRGGGTTTPRLEDFVVIPDALTDGRPTPGDSRSFYDEQPDTTMIPREHQAGLHLRATLRPARGQELFFDLGWRRRVTTMTLPPPRVTSGLDPRFGDGPSGEIIVPAANPYNPFGFDLTSFAFLLEELGLRQREFTNEIPRVITGWRQRFANAWQVDAAVQWTENKVREVSRNQILTADVQAGLAGRAGGFINPFGPSDPGVFDRLRTSYALSQTFGLLTAGVTARGPLGQLGGRPLEGVLGSEVRLDSFRRRPGDDAIAAGAHAAWDPFPRMTLERTVVAAFAETMIPLGSQIDAQLALRGEHYSDFGDSLKPRAALFWRAAPALALRASVGSAFRAPEMLQLLPQPTTNTTFPLDPRRPDLGRYPVTVYDQGDPDLKAENSVTTNLGVVVTAQEWKGFHLSLDRWEIRQRDRIDRLNDDFILRHELDPALPTGYLIGRFADEPDGRPGAIYAIYNKLININRVTTRGMDLELGWTGRAASGTLQCRALVTHLESFERQSATGGEVELAGTTSYPRWRGNLFASWQRDPWSLGWSVTWIGRHDGQGINHLGGSTTQHDRLFHNAQFSRSWGEQWTVAFQVTNVFDTNPPVFLNEKRGYLPGTYENRGRGYGLTVERTW